MKNIVLIIVLFISCALYGQEVIEYNNKAGKVTFTISADEYYKTRCLRKFFVKKKFY